MTISMNSLDLLEAPRPGHFVLPRPEPLVPRLPAGLSRTPTIAPRLVSRDAVPLPTERRRGPAELEFGTVDGAWFREGVREDLPEVVLERRGELPWWTLAIPAVAGLLSVASSVALLALLVH